MPNFPTTIKKTNQVRIWTLSPESLGLSPRAIGGAINASQAWPTGSLALFTPFEVYEPITLLKISITNGATVAGNVDAGIYDKFGTLKVSSGAINHSGTAAIQTLNIASTYLLPGLYYMALALSNPTGTVGSQQSIDTFEMEGLGMFQQQLAFPLPSTATFSAFAQSFVPLMSLSRQTFI